MNFNNKFEKYDKIQTIIDKAWDEFSDYIGEHGLKTPLNFEQFEDIFNCLNINNKFTSFKDQILHSFQHDCYSWPLVEKNKNTQD
ncbi:hypothetical protein D3C81_1111580 [compost metagenome]